MGFPLKSGDRLELWEPSWLKHGHDADIVEHSLRS